MPDDRARRKWPLDIAVRELGEHFLDGQRLDTTPSASLRIDDQRPLGSFIPSERANALRCLECDFQTDSIRII